MHLKQLHERAAWQRTTEAEFKTKITNLILEQQDVIENLSKIITNLEEDILTIKKQIGTNSLQTARLNKTIRSTPKVEDGSTTNAQQKRNR